MSAHRSNSAQTPYFLITDTDTFFLRDFEALDLMHQEEGCNATAGVCDLQKQVSPSSLYSNVSSYAQRHGSGRGSHGEGARQPRFRLPGR